MREDEDVTAPASECCCVKILMREEVIAYEALYDLHAHGLRRSSGHQHLGDIVCLGMDSGKQKDGDGEMPCGAGW